MKHTIDYRDPADLRPHAIRRHIPEPDPEAPDFIALKLSVRDSGIRDALHIDEHNHILKGVRRWRAAKAYQLDSVPVIVHPEAEAPLIIAEGLVARRTMTRGAAVYLLVPILREVVEAAEQRRVLNFTKGKRFGEPAFVAKEIPQNPNDFPKPSNLESRTIPRLCERLGVSDETFLRARTVYAVLHDPACAKLQDWMRRKDIKPPDLVVLRPMQQELREEFEPKLLDGTYNLWNVESGIAGRIVPQDHGRRGEQLELTFDFKGIVSGFQKWKQLERDQRNVVIAGWRNTFKRMPDDLREELVSILEELAR